MLSIGSIAAHVPWALQGVGTAAAGSSAAAVGASSPGVASGVAPGAAARTAGDLQSFLATLNQVLQQSSSVTANATQAIGAASQSAPALVSGLEASFQRLMQDLAVNGGSGLSAAQASAASLQNSLQTQLANLRNIGQSTAGLMLHASA